ncbi:hypothetical protein [Streptacidiphilus fuscans]|uniref:Uncharacterized protein n=1 Tax=Streptacidiphilus fuscans TaxID=2789292 RepID=A0A931B830_9ACTN|nr:hypothetical protein [Streptacidiphilus fuscans]MBF9072839.1 hypothetical protein [Streptacidiphilus fuscans]
MLPIPIESPALVTRIEVRRRTTRSGTPWLEAPIQLSDTNPLSLPGVVEGRSGLPKTEFQRQVCTLLEHWQRATGRTEKVLFLPR